ncbi:MAG: MGMT family protein, partial [Desulfobacterales bacterium]
VWDRICQIPSGATRTYGSLAQSLGNKALARAVGQACAANPIALLIPCHRVVGHTGLGGFAGGIDLKKQLLALEMKG